MIERQNHSGAGKTELGTLFAPPDGGSAQDVVEAEARRYHLEQSGACAWRGPVDGVTGEPPEPDDYRDL